MKPNRKKLIISGMFAILFGIFLLSFTPGGDWPGERNKSKMKKEASKLWKHSSFSVHEIKKPESWFSGDYRRLYKIKEEDEILGFAYIGRVNTCRPGGCSAPSASNTGAGSYEFFDYFLILDKKLAVQEVKILSYNATRGYEIMSKSWLKQFLGYKGNKSMKYGKDIQAISGATISANSITDDIENTINQLKRIKEKGLL